MLPSNFAVYRHDRLTRGGGVLLAVHHSIPSRLLSSPSHLEIVSVEIGLISPLLFCVIYIPHNSSSDYCSKSFQYIESIVSHPCVLIAGDFNFPDICWSSLCGQSPQSDAFCDLIFRHSLVQVVDFPTHLRGGVLDLVLSNSDGLVENVLSFSSKFLRSDHYLLSFTVPSARKRVSEQSKLSYSFNFKKTDLEWLSSFLLDFDFSQIFSSNDIELVWSLLKGIILHFIKLFTPVIRVRSKSYPKWFHSAIRHQLHRVHYLRRRYRKYPSSMRSSQLSSAEL